MTVQNVDYQEIAKFTTLADEWWDKQGAFKPLHDINPLRLDWIDNACFGAWQSNLKDNTVYGNARARAKPCLGR